MDGCPCCGAARLKSAPLPVVSSLVAVASYKRRYRCSDCDWTGWRHRLQRRGGPSMADQVFDGHEVHAKEIVYFIVVSMTFVIFLGVVMKNCADEALPPPTDVSQLQPSAISD